MNNFGVPRSLSEALHTTATVRGATHAFYRYPARFSPEFARTFIHKFTDAGDTVLDCFMGGGTSAVEALSTGRRFVGCDLNSLAFFVTLVKTTELSKNDRSLLIDWRSRLASAINLHSGDLPDDERVSQIPWTIRKTLALAVATLPSLPNIRTRNFARCSLLRTSQWALDCKRDIPNKDEFLDKHTLHFSAMLEGAAEFAANYDRSLGSKDEPARRIFNSAAVDLSSTSTLANVRAQLLITSPPYPGVHVLYHRWQVNGRRETAAPYWLANCLDGQPPSYYTMGPRRPETWERYMSEIRSSFCSVKKLLHRNALVVQLVAFSEPNVQYPLYLSAMRDAGYRKVELAELGSTSDSPIIRSVPNRKWYAQSKGAIAASREYVLVHRQR
ncbi:MAG: hypothetical protein JWQ49_5239 [Edaphobacter sp.]|nr:hypothetical protein [Edaphobacter sp.]